MPRSVEILVTNRNTWDAVQLCVESVRRYTRTRPYSLIVYDDASTNDVDVAYLREAQGKGWLRLIEGRERVGHGRALNVLVNEVCAADYAVIMDSDIEIRKEQWLENLVRLIEHKPRTIAACPTRPASPRGGNGAGKQWWVAPFSEFWFGIVNMEAYRDGMMVDWEPRSTDDRNEMRKLWNAETIPIDDIQYYIWDVGCALYHKVKLNPDKNYRFATSFTEDVASSFYHYRQVSSLYGDNDNPSLAAYLRGVRSAIRHRLEELRREQ